MRKFLLLYILSNAFVSGYGQIEGTYDAANKKFIFKETPYLKSTFRTLTPCVGNYCVIYGSENEIGVIDITGKIMIEPGRYSNIYLYESTHGVYFLLSSGGRVRLLDENRKVLFNSERILPLHSDEGGELFFVETYKSNYPMRMGEVWKVSINRNPSLVLAEHNYLGAYSSSSSNVDASEYFKNALLITPSSSNGYLIRNFKLDTLYKDKYINDFFGSDSLMPIIKTQDSTYYIGENNAKIEFDSYKLNINSRASILIYKTVSKWGMLYYEDKTYHNSATFVKLDPVFDSIYIQDKEINLIRHDTLWCITEYELTNTFYYYTTFYKTWILKNNKQHKLIGEDGKYFDPHKKLEKKFNPIPNTLLMAANFHNYEFANKNFQQINKFNTVNFEAGLGWYGYDTDNDKGSYSHENFLDAMVGSCLAVNTWQMAGLGVGIEYKLPYNITRSKIYDQSGENFRPFYLNTRVELGGGALIFLCIPLAFHLQAGYTTDFLNHYFRYGVGISLLYLQIGVEGLVQINYPSTILHDNGGLYIRYNLSKKKTDGK